MAKSKKKVYQETEDQFGAVEQALSKTERFIENNMKNLSFGFIAILALVVAYFAYGRFVTEPKEKAGENAIFMAQKYFEKDSLDISLNGGGEFAGFLEVMDEYAGTKAGNLAKYYAGLVYYKKGEFDKAIDYLKDFSSDDQIVSSMSLGAIGDAYLEKEDMGQALAYYQKAIDRNENDFVAPIYLQKKAWVYEIQGDWANALSAYEKIQKDYPKSSEASSVKKYIERAKAKIAK